MSFSLINHGSWIASGNADFTTPAFNASGANFLVAIISETGSPAGLTDSLGNTWVVAKDTTGTGPNTTLLYVASATVSSAMTFTTSTGNGAPALFVAAFAVTGGTPTLDQSAAANPGLSNNFQIGSITPTANGALIISGTASFGGSGQSINQSFTITDSSAGSGGNAWGGGTAYLIQTTAAAVNPTWADTAAVFESGANVSFTISGGGTPGTANLDSISLAAMLEAPQASGAASAALSTQALTVTPESVSASGIAQIAISSQTLSVALQTETASGAAQAALGSQSLALAAETMTASGAALTVLGSEALTLDPLALAASGGGPATANLGSISLDLTLEALTGVGAAQAALGAVSLILASQMPSVAAGAVVTLQRIPLMLALHSMQSGFAPPAVPDGGTLIVRTLGGDIVITLILDGGAVITP